MNPAAVQMDLITYYFMMDDMMTLPALMRLLGNVFEGNLKWIPFITGKLR